MGAAAEVAAGVADLHVETRLPRTTRTRSPKTRGENQEATMTCLFITHRVLGVARLTHTRLGHEAVTGSSLGTVRHRNRRVEGQRSSFDCRFPRAGIFSIVRAFERPLSTARGLRAGVHPSRNPPHSACGGVLQNGSKR